jgi:hypothetical protein
MGYGECEFAIEACKMIIFSSVSRSTTPPFLKKLKAIVSDLWIDWLDLSIKQEMSSGCQNQVKPRFGRSDHDCKWKANSD